MKHLRIGEFDLVALIGRGGMGQVWRAVSPGLGSAVALKFMNPSDADDASLRAKFLEEARTAASLNHPGIVTIITHGEGEYMGHVVPYIVMQWIDGVDIRKLVSKTREMMRSHVPAGAAAFIVGEALRILSYAHNHLAKGKPRSVIHHDISPGNIMIDAYANLKVLDFGLAKVDHGITKRSSPFGTLDYMSPEQLRGAVRTQSDLYSLGALLHFILSGDSPLAHCHSLEAKHLELLGASDPPRLDRRDVPPELEALRVGLLQKRREKRLSTADEALALLGPEYRVHQSTLLNLYRELFGGSRTGTTDYHPVAPREEPPQAASAPPQLVDLEPPDDEDDDALPWGSPDEPDEQEQPGLASSTVDLRGSVELENPAAVTPTTVRIEDDAPAFFRRSDRTSQLMLGGSGSEESSASTPPMQEQVEDAPRTELVEPLFVSVPVESSPTPVENRPREEVALVPVKVQQPEATMLVDDVHRRPTWPQRLEDSIEDNTDFHGQATSFQIVRASASRSAMVGLAGGATLVAILFVVTFWAVRPPQEVAEQASAGEPDAPTVEIAPTASLIGELTPPDSPEQDLHDPAPQDERGEPQSPVPSNAAEAIPTSSPAAPAEPEEVANPISEDEPSVDVPPTARPAAAPAAAKSSPTERKPKPRPKVSMLLSLPTGKKGSIKIGRYKASTATSMFTDAEIPPGSYKLKWTLAGESVEHDAGTLEVAALEQISYYVIQLGDGSHTKTVHRRPKKKGQP